MRAIQERLFQPCKSGIGLAGPNVAERHVRRRDEPHRRGALQLVEQGPRPRLLARAPHLLETSLPGVFAVGDVRSGNIKRVASAVGEGSIAISLVHQVLQQ